MRTTAVAVTALALLLWTPTVAWADPVLPQPGTPCSSDLSDAMTWLPDDTSPLECLNNQWQAVTSPQPPNDRWLTLGPPITLHGEGLRNPNVASGAWTATPQDAASQCRAEQQAVVSAGEVGPPQVAESPKGQPLSFQVVPQLFSIELSGHCLWTRSGDHSDETQRRDRSPHPTIESPNPHPH
jgi:hypothetical protein